MTRWWLILVTLQKSFCFSPGPAKCHSEVSHTPTLPEEQRKRNSLRPDIHINFHRWVGTPLIISSSGPWLSPTRFSTLSLFSRRRSKFSTIKSFFFLFARNSTMNGPNVSALPSQRSVFMLIFRPTASSPVAPSNVKILQTICMPIFLLSWARKLVYPPLSCLYAGRKLFFLTCKNCFLPSFCFLTAALYSMLQSERSSLLFRFREAPV